MQNNFLNKIRESILRGKTYKIQKKNFEISEKILNHFAEIRTKNTDADSTQSQVHFAGFKTSSGLR